MKAERLKLNWHPGLSIFASEPFLKAVGDEYGWLGGIDKSHRLRCILPYTIIKKAVFRMIRFRIETIPVGGDLAVEEEKAFLNNAVDYFRKIGGDVIIPATTNTIFRTYPQGAVAAPYGTYIIDLNKPQEVIWGKLSSSHRRKVRLAIKKGVQIKTGLEYTDTAYILVRNTFSRSKIPFMSLNSFRRIVSGLDQNVKIFIADFHGAVQGCLVIPFSDYCAYYVYGGSIPDPIPGATNLLHWEAIRMFHEMGVKRYDFVGVRIDPKKGSKQEGLAMYKERFGGQLIEGYMWKYNLNNWKYGMYSLAVRLLRGGDIVDNEHHKLKR